MSYLSEKHGRHRISHRHTVLRESHVFLSRPRRFGKSLLLSTIHSYFYGRRDLFKGLAIYSADVDWTPMPVLHIDLNTGLYKTPDGLTKRLSETISEYEDKFGVDRREDLDPAPSPAKSSIFLIYEAA